MASTGHQTMGRRIVEDLKVVVAAVWNSSYSFGSCNDSLRRFRSMMRTLRSICTSRGCVTLSVLKYALCLMNTWRCWLNRDWTANEEVVCWLAPCALREYVHWTRRDRASNDSAQEQLFWWRHQIQHDDHYWRSNKYNDDNKYIFFASATFLLLSWRQQRPRYFRLMISFRCWSFITHQAPRIYIYLWIVFL